MRALLALAVMLLLSGCGVLKTVKSSGDTVIDWGRSAVAAAGNRIHPVTVKKLPEREGQPAFLLRQQYDEPPQLGTFALDNTAMRLCPKGYLLDTSYAVSPRKFGDSRVECVGADCRYALVWKIHCEEVPREPFSIFGKF